MGKYKIKGKWRKTIPFLLAIGSTKWVDGKEE